MIYTCCDQLRRDLVAANNKKSGAPLLNGIDYVEVLDHDAPTGSPRQRTLMVHLLLPEPALTTDNIRIEGGARVRDIKALWVALASNPPVSVVNPERSHFTGLAQADHIFLVRTDSDGDHSTYTLRLVNSAANADTSPPPGFDPRLCEVDFSFKVECPSPFDCAPVRTCPPRTKDVPDINYLAKDYPSFRTLILDRLSQLLPGWNANSAADMGVALAELIACVGDQFSYQQDAASTEAYLNTARRRVSLKRHALLVDYLVHDGCNARAWVQVQVNGDAVPLAKKGTRFYTRIPGLPPVFASGSREAQVAARSSAQVFEPMIDAVLYQDHNQMSFYTWSDGRCCIPAGAVAATLAGQHPNLKQGDVLVLKEILGPMTGESADADPGHRWAVRLTQVLFNDAGGNPLTDPLPNRDGSINQITEIQWSEEDALPFPLCLSSVTDSEHGSKPLPVVSAAFGNIVPADHGLSVDAEDLGQVPEPALFYAPDPNADRCNPPLRAELPPRYRPLLANGPLTQAGPLDLTVDPVTKLIGMNAALSASQAMIWNGDDVKPAIVLTEKIGSASFTWNPERDLLYSSAEATDFISETEYDGSTRLRFGNDVNGKRPPSGAAFTAYYRVGNGTAGNVGAESLSHVLATDARITGITNLLPAAGGTEPETSDQIRRRAPQAFRTQERAVTPSDYEEKADLYPAVQRTAASFRWTGSWHTVFLTVDPVGGGKPSAELRSGLAQYMERYRMAGYDLQIDSPLYVSLEIELLICVKDDYFRSDVEQALLIVLGSGALADGTRGLFHPDNFTFGQTVYLSKVYATARSVEGVASVQAVKFQRQGLDDNQYLVRSEMSLGSLEIARLDNDPNFPENGILKLIMCGGK